MDSNYIPDLTVEELEDIRTRINKALSKRHISDTGLSEMTGINRSSVFQYTSGGRLPTLENSIKICKALNVSLDWLVFGNRDIFAEGYTKGKKDLFKAIEDNVSI